ncbi:MAG TPA: AmmeMemoRadiSam system protein A [Campylobacterales bacterium]|nr:AmmeMemoRadiSam system protein A [Campylobacterales bacterium]
MDKKLLLQIAHDAIEGNFTRRDINRTQLLQENPELKKEGAVFVTLRQQGHLRGCIGSLVAHRSLLDDVVHNAKAAAFSDPRFQPLSSTELNTTDIEVSLLSSPEELEYKDREELKKKIRPNIDGVILQLGNHRATFLPQVWEEIPEFDLFFGHLCQKAGVRAEGCLERHPTIFTYQVEKIES